MTEHSLTTTELKIIEPDNDDRKYLIAVGARAASVRVYLRMNDTGDADFIFARDGAALVRLVLPAQRPLYAWTSTGTATATTMVEQ